MQKYTKITLWVLILTLFSCSSHQPLVSRHIDKLDSNMPGTLAYYYLPRTVFTIDMEIVETTHTPGPYAEFAETYLGLDQVIISPSQSYEIAGITIRHFAEPDPEHIYFVLYPPEYQEPFLMSLSESGLIAGVNRLPGHPLDTDEGDDSMYFGIFGSDKTFNYFLDTALKERIDTITEQLRLDTITVQRQTLRRSWVEKSRELRAQEVADYILEIREKRFDLISGFQEINYSKEALEYMVTQMNQMESDYLDLFTGITGTRHMRYRYVVRPGREDISRAKVLAHFSPDAGILTQDGGAGQPVRVLFERSKATDRLHTRIGTQQDPRQKASGGFHYRIPEYADVLLLLGDDKKAEARALVSQFGIVGQVPARELEIEFYPASGSIRSVGTALPENKD